MNTEYGMHSLIYLTQGLKDDYSIYAVPISFWPILGKETRYFYTRHSNINRNSKQVQLVKKC